jgi:FlaA1/EpsC-like NDP-sugar epimerase
MNRRFPPAEPDTLTRSSLAVRTMTGAWKYGLAFAAQVTAYFAILVAGEIIASGGIHRRILVVGPVLVVLAMGAAEARFQLYKRVWTVASLSDAVALVKAISETTVLITAANALLPNDYRPFAILVPLLSAPVVLTVLGTFRLLPRLMRKTPIGESRLLIVVADSDGFATIKSVTQSPSPLWSPVGIVTRSRSDLRKTVMGIPVVGVTQDLAHWILATKADGVAFVPDLSGKANFQDLFSVCIGLEKPIFIMPDPGAWFPRSGAGHIRQLTADDLVGRPQQDFDMSGISDAVAGRTVLITGAAGSIGSELCRILATLDPGRLILLDNNESGLFDIAEQLRNTSAVDIQEVLMSVTEKDSLIAAFTETRPEIVFHAAAYKHVPLLETHPEQAVLVNVMGTLNTLRCAELVGARKFVLISTDKAATVHSVMGCTKRMCEQIVLGHQGQTSTWAVRFGNVVGSRGSVVPTFQRQIERGGPVTITHPDVSRFMMTIREAALLVISTLSLANSGDLYMLDMGDRIKIVDLANALIRSRGLRPGKDVQVVFTGLRPGERMTEELLAPDEGVRPTRHPSILKVVTQLAIRPDELGWTLERMMELIRERQSGELVRVLRQAVAPRATASVEEPTVFRQMGSPQDAETTEGH